MSTIISTAPMQLKFDFINEKGGQRLKDRDAVTQHTIRKRATQAAAATKKREGRNEKVNVIQYPPWIAASNSTAHAASPGEERTSAGTRNKPQEGSREYPLERKEQSVFRDGTVPFSLQTLETLSPLNYSFSSPVLRPEEVVSLLPSLKLQETLIATRSSHSLTARDKNKTRKILRLTSDDFITILVERYGQSKTLDVAIDCLGARTKQILGGTLPLTPTSDSSTFLYGRALRLMKQDIDNCTMRKSNVTTWLAVLVLALYELLNTADQMAWILHSNGAGIMLQKAGPKAMNDELHKSILTIVTPIVAVEALLSGNGCFLAHPDWQEAMENAIIADAETLDDRGELFTSLRMLFVCIPNLFNDVTSIVLDGISSAIFDLLSSLQMLKAQFTAWRIRWDTELHHKLIDRKSEDHRLYALTLSRMASAVVDRLLLAINSELMLELEASAIQMAQEAIESIHFTNLPTKEAEVRVGLMVDVAESIVATSCHWEMALCEPNGRATIDPQVFVDWCRLLGRPVRDFSCSPTVTDWSS